jgi:hypothetical protein
MYPEPSDVVSTVLTAWISTDRLQDMLTERNRGRTGRFPTQFSQASATVDQADITKDLDYTADDKPRASCYVAIGP